MAVMSEGFEIIGDQLPRELFESIEEIVEAAGALRLSGGSDREVESLELIADWGLTVRSLDGLAQI